MTREKATGAEISRNIWRPRGGAFICYQGLNKSFYQHCSSYRGEGMSEGGQVREISPFSLSPLHLCSELIQRALGRARNAPFS